MSRQLLFLIIYLCGVGSSLQSNEVNETSLNSLIQKKFFPQRSKVPDYKLAKLVRNNRTKREIREVEFLVDNRKIVLNLSPLKRNVVPLSSPVWTLETDSNTKLGHVYKRQAIDIDCSFYEDEKNKAVLCASYVNGYIFYDGVIGEGKNYTVIKPMIENWRYEDSDHIFINQGQNNYTILISQYSNFSHLDELKKMDKPLDVLYPKHLVMVEATYYKELGMKSINEVVKYMTIFWNAVNLKFREIQYPKVEFTITGIVVNKDENALPFLNVKKIDNITHLDYADLFNIGNPYFEKEFGKNVNFENYNSAIVMSYLSRLLSVSGMTFQNNACNKGVIYVTDDTKFGGVLVAAHELGHSLGMIHDDENITHDYNYSTILHPYTTSRATYYDQFHWTQFAVDQLKIFSSTELAECLSIKP